MNKRSKLPKGWDAARIKRVLTHYESQTVEQAVAEDQTAAGDQTFVEVPNRLVPAVRALIAKHRKASKRRRTSAR